VEWNFGGVGVSAVDWQRPDLLNRQVTAPLAHANLAPSDFQNAANNKSQQMQKGVFPNYLL
jgi:hypothetical protein